MRKKTEALKLALKALEWNMCYLPSHGSDTAIATNAITALRIALAEQPAQQEPVAWISKHGVVYPLDAKDEVHPINELQPLYTSPPAQRKPLSDEQMADFLGDRYHSMTENELEFFRLGEAAHGIKENT